MADLQNGTALFGQTDYSLTFHPVVRDGLFH
jgi:hypothetical protein